MQGIIRAFLVASSVCNLSASSDALLEISDKMLRVSISLPLFHQANFALLFYWCPLLAVVSVKAALKFTIMELPNVNIHRATMKFDCF